MLMQPRERSQTSPQGALGLGWLSQLSPGRQGGIRTPGQGRPGAQAGSWHSDAVSSFCGHSRGFREVSRAQMFPFFVD